MRLDEGIWFLNRVIVRQSAALHSQMALASGLVLLGLGAITVASLVMSSDLKWIPTLGGLFVPTLSGFPLKEVFARRDKITALTLLLVEAERIRENSRSVDGEEIELKDLIQRITQLVGFTLGG